MKDFIINAYAYLYCSNRKNNYKKVNTFKWLLSNIGYRLMGMLLFGYMQAKNLLNIPPKTLDKNSNIIVSLTTFPARIDTVWMAIDSIFCQKVKPRKVILYLTKEEFSDEERALPKILTRYVGKGLEVRFVENNLMPHNKYSYAFREVLRSRKSDLVVTIDDDIYYRDDMIERLLLLHEKFPDCVCSNVVHEIKQERPYNEWVDTGQPFCPSHKYLGLGVSGVLYPVSLFKDKRMFDEELIAKYCLKADDLWLKAFELINGIKVVTGDFYIPMVEILGTQGISLTATNTNAESEVNNDTQWANLNKLFEVDSLLPPPPLTDIYN